MARTGYVATVIVALIAASGLSACGGDARSGRSGALTVFAAASLTGAFTEIGEAFMEENPDVEVTFNFAASSELVTQITEGAPADVFASADRRNMDELVEAERNDGEPAVFATNSLAIILEPGNPQEITGLADLADPDLIVVSCDPAVPIGAYTQEVLGNVNITAEFDSFEEDVKAIVTKVTAGEADAGIVYATDVTAAGDDAAGVEIPANVNITAEYPMVAVADAPNGDGAGAWIGLVAGDAGQEILATYGFGSP